MTQATGSVPVTGLAVMTAAGRGPEPLLAAALAGEPTFTEIERFDPGQVRTRVAATLPETRSLFAELVDAVDAACADAAMTAADRAECPLLLAVGTGTSLVRAGCSGAGTPSAGSLAAAVAERCGLAAAARSHTAACVAASNALAEAASMIVRGRCRYAVVAAGFLVDADHQALFDAGRALADDGQVRPFSKGRRGLLLGDGVGAVVLSASDSVRARIHGRLIGWGRAGDAYHVCQPHPGGTGLAWAIDRALARAGLAAADLGYINANGTGTSYADAAESAALRAVLGPALDAVPVSSTKSVHGHALEASGLIEFVLTLLSLGAGRLPINAGFVAPDDECPLRLVWPDPMAAPARHALSLNFAFGGANTALVVAA